MAFRLSATNEKGEVTREPALNLVPLASTTLRHSLGAILPDRIPRILENRAAGDFLRGSIRDRKSCAHARIISDYLRCPETEGLVSREKRRSIRIS